jgi:hypothetical protein
MSAKFVPSERIYNLDVVHAPLNAPEKRLLALGGQTNRARFVAYWTVVSTGRRNTLS